MEIKTPHNFGGLPKKFSDYKKSKVTILPVPFDKTASWMKGTQKGPKAIISASRNFELYDIETNSEVYKKGIFTEKEIIAETSVSMINQVYEKVKNLIDEKKFVVTLGGEHSISIGTIKAHFGFFDNLSILHLDAHTDMRNSYQGNKYSHASTIARVKEITSEIISVGIRSMDSSELKNIDKEKIIYADEIYRSKNWTEKVIRKLSKNVYITIDVDVFDVGIMPSTGTPEPGGLDWYQVTGLLKKVSQKYNIVGFDVVELSPSQNKAPDFLVAKLIYKLLSYNSSLIKG